MKLQKQLSRVVDNKEYDKWLIVIPPSTIDKIGWKDGDRLKEEIQGKTLLIRRMNTEEILDITKKEIKPSYNDFKEKIETLLNKNPDGLTWTDIKQIGRFSQKVPNNKWVKKLEEDIQLVRHRDRNRGIVWKLK